MTDGFQEKIVKQPQRPLLLYEAQHNGYEKDAMSYVLDSEFGLSMLLPANSIHTYYNSGRVGVRGANSLRANHRSSRCHQWP